MKMNQINSVCVYSASSTKIDAVYFQAADTLGYLLAEHRIRLINGAGSIGLMRSVADAVLKNGGEVTGVIPRFMVAGVATNKTLFTLIQGKPELKNAGDDH